MASALQSEVSAKMDHLIAEIISTVRPIPRATLLKEALVEIGKLLLDPAMQERAAPVSQMWRLLMGLHIAGALTEDELYEFAGQVRGCSLQLYPVTED